MNERIEKSLYDIQNAVREIDMFFDGGTKLFDDFRGNVLLRRGVERNPAIIGEATNRILKIDPDFPLSKARKIVDMRNYVIHGYDSLSVDMVWNIVINHLPLLRTEVDRLLG
jgi:uncharacterized protein with HEPN domain